MLLVCLYALTTITASRFSASGPCLDYLVIIVSPCNLVFNFHLPYAPSIHSCSNLQYSAFSSCTQSRQMLAFFFMTSSFPSIVSWPVGTRCVV